MTKTKMTKTASINEILLRRKNAVILRKSTSATKLPLPLLTTFSINLKSLGYHLSQEVMDVLATASVTRVEAFYNELVEKLTVIRGANKTYTPMYKNFPQEVMEMSDAELYLNAIIHYATGMMPESEERDNYPFGDFGDTTAITLGKKSQLDKIFTDLLNSALSEQDTEDVTWFVKNYKIDKLIPETIPIKETASVLNGLFWDENHPIIAKSIKNATDVLRLAVKLSEGDESLAKTTKFRNFSRPERKRLLILLDSCGAITEDMLRWKMRWIRLGEKLHVGDYDFPKIHKAYDVLRNNKKFETFNSKVEKALEQKDIDTVTDLLEKRPGDFARRLDHTLRLGKKPATVINKFKGVAPQVSTPVLLQVKEHFKHRGETSQKDLRIFMPKGKIANINAVPNTIKEPLAGGVPKKVIKVCDEALIEKFSTLPDLGKCYIDADLKNYKVPFSNRSASSGQIKTIVRGSRLAMDDSRFLRMFTWWQNMTSEQKEAAGEKVYTSRVDVDLSTLIYKDNFKTTDHVSWTNLKSGGVTQSGDITSAPRPKGAAEFIDIDKEQVVKRGIEYIVMVLYSYTQQPFNLMECYAGFMSRDESMEGQVFEPSTIENKIQVASESTNIIPIVYDVQNNEIVWADLAQPRSRTRGRIQMVETTLGSTELAVKSIIDIEKPNLHDLVELHAKARGEIVTKEEDADIVFSSKELPFQWEEIYSEYVTIV